MDYGLTVNGFLVWTLDYWTFVEFWTGYQTFVDTFHLDERADNDFNNHLSRRS